MKSEDWKSIRKAKPQDKDMALAVILGRDRAQGEVGGPEQASRQIPEDFLLREARTYRTFLYEMFGWMQFRQYFEVPDAPGEFLVTRFENALEKAYAKGVADAEWARTEHDMRKGAAATRGMLEALLSSCKTESPETDEGDDA